MHPLRRVVATVIVGALAAGCTSAQAPAPTTSAIPIPASIAPASIGLPTFAPATLPPTCSNPCPVTMVNRAYKPKRLSVKVGTEVIWTNVACDGGCTVTFAPEVGVDSGPMALGATFKHTFTTVGAFRFHCMLDPDVMVGYITVTG